MNPEIKNRWEEALRSGLYKQQSEGYLKFQGRYCCLGVLTDLYLKDHNLNWTDKIDSRCKMVSKCTYLPTEVQKWAGIDGIDPENLSRKNDLGVNFADIANIIEKKL